MSRNALKEEYNFEEKFAIMHFLDKIRWDTSNAGSADFNTDIKLNTNETILTHWLLYITERQMSFEQIWDKGGIVFSEVVKSYTKDGPNSECIKIIKSEKGDSRKTHFGKDGKQDDDGNDTYSFTALKRYRDLRDSVKNRVSKYYSEAEKESNPFIEFKSRFFTTDYLSMSYTLYTLSHDMFGGSIIKYLAECIKLIFSADLNLSEKIDYCVRGMAYALYRLTYNNTEKDHNILYFAYENKKDYISYKNNLEKFIVDSGEFMCRSEIRTAKIVEDIYTDSQTLIKNINEFYKSNDTDAPKFSSMKRTWCALRDYLKSPKYKNDFKEALLTELPNYEKELSILFDEGSNCQNACRLIELPGDVWNENSTFRVCITENHRGKLGKVLREQYDKLYKSYNFAGYPEEFDTTFDFVPRMCEKGNCDICPFASLKPSPIKLDIENKISKLCVDDETKYCPLVLIYCGYYHTCTGKDTCALIGKFLNPLSINSSHNDR